VRYLDFKLCLSEWKNKRSSLYHLVKFQMKKRWQYSIFRQVVCSYFGLSFESHP